MATPDELIDAWPAPDPLFAYEPTDLDDFSVDEVQRVWDHRRTLCGSVEAAAEAFAILRVARGLDQTYRGWRAVLAHTQIRELAEDLPYLFNPDLRDGRTIAEPSAHEDVASEPEKNPATVEQWLVDTRQVAARNVRLRQGQSRFREEVLGFHGGRCCVTGCTEDVLLEAAHITPYKG